MDDDAALVGQVDGLLAEECRALSDVGAGVALAWGGAMTRVDVFEVRVGIDNTDRLYELMRAEATKPSRTGTPGPSRPSLAGGIVLDMVTPSPAGDLTLRHVFAAAGIDLNDVVVIRHTVGGDALGPDDQTPDGLRRYTRSQSATLSKFPRNPPRYWVCFLANGGRRSRLLVVFENYGEVVAERTREHRFYDLRETEVLSSLVGRLVIEWGKDAINWSKSGILATHLPVIQIADPDAVPFPGFDKVLLTHTELQTVIADPRYATWRTALGSVQGIYLIADTSSGQLYVGKADGSERILGRWTHYAADGHGGNIALHALAGADTKHARHFVFSLLRVFGPSTPMSEVDGAESHFKRALLTRSHGLNRN